MADPVAVGKPQPSDIVSAIETAVTEIEAILAKARGFVKGEYSFQKLLLPDLFMRFL